MVNNSKKSFGEAVDDADKGEEMLTVSDKPYAEASPEVKKEPLPRFRAHFRTSANSEKQHMDVAVEDVGDVHTQVRAAHETDDVKVFIDKVKRISV